MDADLVFKALADPTRRTLLDALYQDDGQTLGALVRRLTLTRFGVMKHLRVLEEAGLVVTRRRGREKLHFLNPVPIRLIHDRWIDKYTAPWAAMLSGLKHDLEAQMEKVFEIYIKTTPERLWQAIVDPEMRAKYTFGVGVYSDWTPGSAYTSRAGAGTVGPDMPIAEGENIEVDPPRRLVQSFRALWSEDVRAEGTSRVTWEIEPVATHAASPSPTTSSAKWPTASSTAAGRWCFGLKTLLETGELLTTPGSLMYLRQPAASQIG